MSLYEQLQFDPIEEAIEAFRAHNFVIILDSPSRENEGDLVIAASAMTPEKMAFMVYHTSGLICTPIMPDLARGLNLPLMVKERESKDPNKTAYTISIDANHPSITTGISAHDRALTCTQLASCTSEAITFSKTSALNPTLFRRPGHIFPLCACPGLTRQRPGHTEAALEFCRLARLPLVGVIGELVESGVEIPGRAERKNPDMMRGRACLEFGRKWGLKCCTINDLLTWVQTHEKSYQYSGSG